MLCQKECVVSLIPYELRENYIEKRSLVLFCLAGRGWLLRCGPRTQNVLGESDHHIRELNAVVKKRFIELNAEKVATRSLCAIAQAESLCYKLILRQGLRGGRVRKEYYATATPLRQGEFGIQVKIMLPWDPNGIFGPKESLSDNVKMVEPEDEIMYNTQRTQEQAVGAEVGSRSNRRVMSHWNEHSNCEQQQQQRPIEEEDQQPEGRTTSSRRRKFERSGPR
ncbi:ribosomal protein S3 [Culex quinquefasciatus]|uniref:Ribosomal protein S3 n=1 Tax=Culex quinquefasciatus TaxID=7176 RepID=B0XEZ2_CULQU|nr:ribosomal protein S3 [Culex quinquefasciatus]|eukprot:XP_001868214.1 ribosomal protein S3 [Culex quinquefasciatus]